ncbi:MAG: glutaredoxin family protein, partial [Blastopirellula sp. JB062]
IKRIMTSPHTLLYTRPGCHLCDDAEQILLRHGITPQHVNIDESHELTEKYGCCIPVVEMNGKVRFRGRIDEMLLRRLLSAIES